MLPTRGGGAIPTIPRRSAIRGMQRRNSAVRRGRPGKPHRSLWGSTLAPITFALDDDCSRASRPPRREMFKTNAELFNLKLSEQLQSGNCRACVGYVAADLGTALQRVMPAVPEWFPNHQPDTSTPVRSRLLTPRASRCPCTIGRRAAMLVCPGSALRIPLGTPARNPGPSEPPTGRTPSTLRRFQELGGRTRAPPGRLLQSLCTSCPAML